MSQFEGLVEQVETEQARSFATADAAISDTVVFVADVAPFLTESGACVVDIAGVEYDATPDEVTESLTVSPALSVAVAEMDPIVLVPAAEIKWAWVSLPDDDSVDLVQCRVPHELKAYTTLTDGPRTLGEREAVLVETEPFPAIVTVLNQRTSFDAGFINPDTTVPPAALTDGEPPASSPQPTLEAFAVGGLKWSVSPVANADPVKFRVYADTVDPPTVDAAHLVADTSATSGSFADINGVALLPTDPDVEPDPIFVACVEYDADGEAAVSATSASAVPRRATTGDISSAYVYTGILQANQIEAGTFEADLALVGRLSVGNFTVVDGDTGSITIYADAEHTEPLIQLDPAGSVFRGRVIADEVSVLNGLILQGTDSHIAQNAGITLDNTINDPTSAPTLSLVPETSAWPAVPAGYTNRGIAWDGSNWLRLIAQSGGFTRVQTIDTDGDIIGSTALDNDGLDNGFANSVVRIGSLWFTVTRNVDRWELRKYDVADGSLGEFVPGPYHSLISSSRPCVGTDGTNLLLAYTRNDGTLVVEVYDPDDLFNPTATYTASGAPLGHHMFVGRGNFDFGADRIVICVGDTVHVYSLSGTTLVEETDETFTLPSNAATGGLTWDGSHFHSTHGAALLNKYPDYYPGASENAYVSYRDTDGSDHTKDSPHASIAMIARRFIQATLGPAPSGAATPAVYAALATSDPADTALLLRSETVTGRTILIDPSVAGGTDLDPDSNTFGTGTPAWIKSQAGGFEVYGDGDGAWPKLGQSDEKTLSSAASPTSTTNIDMNDLDMSVHVNDTTDIVWVRFDAAISFTVASTVNIIELLVDGTPHAKQLITRGATTDAIPGSKSWRLTGLSAGTHTIEFRTRNSAGSTGATVNATHTSASYWTLAG